MAQTASYVLNAVSASFAQTASFINDSAKFPFSGSAIITGSLIISSSNQEQSLQLYGSGSTIFSIEGSRGTLFSIDDDESDGKLFSVNNVSGTPVLEVHEDNTVKLGKQDGFGIIISGSNPLPNDADAKILITGSIYHTGSNAYFNAPLTASSFKATPGIINQLTASYAISASVEVRKEVSSSYADTASYVETAQTASYVTTAQTASYVLNAVSSSYALSASYSDTASFALNVTTPTLQQVTTAGQTTSGSIIITNNSGNNKSWLGTTGVDKDGFLALYTGSGVNVYLRPGTSYINANLHLGGSGNITNQLQVTGDALITSNLTASGNISASGHISASSFNATPGTINELTASYALTASFITTAQTASYIEASNIDGTITSASYALSASLAQTASFITLAQTSSYVLASNIDQPFTNITSSGNISASGLIEGNNLKAKNLTNTEVIFAGTDGNLTSDSAFTYNTTTERLTVPNLTTVSFTASFITSSTIETSGSNIFGDEAGVDIQTLVGTTKMTGSAQVTGSLNISENLIVSTGSFNRLEVSDNSKLQGDLTVDDNVGIGTTAGEDGAKLNVRGTASFSADPFGRVEIIPVTGGGQTAVIKQTMDFPRNGGNLQIQADYYVQGGNLYFATSGDNKRMTINRIGNIGIGTTAPTEKLQVAGNISASGYVSASEFVGLITTAKTASYVETAQTASFVTLAQTASYVTLAQTASFVTTAQTASYVTTAQTASYILNAVSSSYALSSSFALTASHALDSDPFPYTGSAIISGSLLIEGTTKITGSAQITGSSTLIDGNFTINGGGYFDNKNSSGTQVSRIGQAGANGGEMILSDNSGTAKIALTPTTANFKTNITSSGNISASGYISASEFVGLITTAQTASYVTTAQTASYVTTAQTASYVLNAVSSSYALSASYAVTASHALNSDPFPYTGSAIIDIKTGEFTVKNSDEPIDIFKVDGNQNRITIDPDGVGTELRIRTNSTINNAGVSIGSDIATTNALTLGTSLSNSNSALVVTGSTTVTGNITGSIISASGYISASEFVGLVTTAQTASYVLASNIDQPFTNITASGNISASGVVYAGAGVFGTAGIGMGGLSVEGMAIMSHISSSGDIIANSLDIRGASGNITASGNISASGDVITKKVGIIDGAGFGLGFEGGGNENSDVQIFTDGTGEINFVKNSVSALAINSNNQIVIRNSYDLTIEDNISASGYISTETNITASGNISASGHISASSFNATPGIINELTASHAVNVQPENNFMPVVTHTTNFNSTSSYAGHYNIVGGTLSITVTTGSTPTDLTPGMEWNFFQTSSGDNFTFTAGTGVNLLSRNMHTKLAAIGSAATLKYISNQTFHLIGDLTL